MAEWIKIEHTTPDKPEVARMADRLKMDPDAVTGKLLRVWIWADQNSVAGDVIQVTESFIDRLAHRKGFAAAMRAVGWISGEDGGLSFGNFERHNGATAKARAMENRKKASQRERDKSGTQTDRRGPDHVPDSVPMPSGQMAGRKPGPEIEGEGEEELKNPTIPPPGELAGSVLNIFSGSSLVMESAAFAAYCLAHPKKTHRAPARLAWNEAILSGATVDQIMAGLKTSPRVVGASSADKVVNPAVFLAERCWEDQPAPPPPQSPSYHPSRFGF